MSDSQTEKPVEDIDYYLENGFLVFKEIWHLKRGFCCKNGCRHCPYGFHNDKNLKKETHIKL